VTLKNRFGILDVGSMGAADMGTFVLTLLYILCTYLFIYLFIYLFGHSPSDKGFESLKQMVGSSILDPS
jgi:hypothetical protein